MERNHEEVRKMYVDLMGPELGQLYHELQDEVTWVHRKWHEFGELFGKGSERIDLLNETAPYFFWLLQQTILEDVLLHLSRLTDPSRTMNRDNLTVRRLPELVSDEVLKKRVEALTQEVLENCAFTRDWRNRRLAHADLQTSRNPEALAPANLQDVESALESMRGLMNCFEAHFCQPDLAYRSVIAIGGADSLIHCLEVYLRHQEEQKAQWQKIVEDQANRTKRSS